jgi:glycosyltransferase involved in cell wall biosynthesis
MSRRLRVLLSAYACEPALGSEPGVGWNNALQAARFHEVWVLTRRNNRLAIERELARRPLPHAHWVYYDLPRCLRFWKRGQRGVHLYYYLWQLGAFRRVRRLQARIGFDLLHHVTFVNYWKPSLLALLAVPFLWGPVGGGEDTPRRFRGTLGWRGRLYELQRDAARWCGEHDPCVRLTARRAQLVLATTPETAARLRRLHCRTVRLLGESALAAEDIRPPSARPAAGSLRLVSVGRLIHWKGYHLALQAFASMHAALPSSSYWLVGDGPERQRLARLAASLGIRGVVRFLGARTRVQAQAILAGSDVLVHPSLHDSGGWTCLEGMAAGLPVICFDAGGSSVQVTPECGVLLPADDPARAVAQMAEAMLRLGRDPRLRIRLGKAGRRRVLRSFCWDAKGEAMRDIYAQVADRRQGE